MPVGVGPVSVREPAGLLPGRFSRGPLEAEVPVGLEILAELRAAEPDLPGWVNFPLLNRTGRAGDLSIDDYTGPLRRTAHAERMPVAAQVADRLGEQGFSVSYARIAVLRPGQVLRPHVDMPRSLRVIVPLNEDPAFRHVFAGISVCMRTAEIWAVDTTACHGAVNLSSTRSRVALLFDIRPGSRPADWSRDWQIPAERRLQRLPWTDRRRDELAQEFRVTLAGEGLEAAETGWFRSVAQVDCSPEAGYAALVQVLRELAEDALVTEPGSHGDADIPVGPGDPGPALVGRAEHWVAHACLCVPHHQ